MVKWKSPWDSLVLLVLVAMVSFLLLFPYILRELLFPEILFNTEIPITIRVILAFLFFLSSARIWYVKRRYIISPLGWMYPVNQKLKRNPKIKDIINLNDQRLSSGQGSL